MLTVESIVKIDGAGLSVFSTRLNREIASAKRCLPHIVDAMKEMGLVIIRLGELR
jgi:hypothetical protein